MPDVQPRRNPFFTNPFFMILLIASVAFVVSTLGYLVSPYVLEQTTPGEPSRRLAEWLDARGPLLLSIEFGVMFVSAIVAMATDDRFAGAPPRSP